MTSCRILIACVGNIFLGDDAFGVEVARRLARVELPEGVRVIDFGIRGLDLTYALLDASEAVILVDAAPRGGRPGTLYVVQLPLDDPAEGGDGVLVEAHNLDPARVLRLASTLARASAPDPCRLRAKSRRRVGKLRDGDRARRPVRPSTRRSL